MIAGGGNIGAGLARSLEKNHSVKLLERNKERAAQLSEMLDNTVVFCGDASDQELLSEEHIDKWMCSSRLLTTMKQTLCLRCWQSVWAHKKPWCLFSVALMLT